MLGSGAALLGGALPWVLVFLRDGGSAEVSGSSAAPAVSGLALSGLALAGALTLAPPVLRRILGAVQLVLGAVLAAVCLPALADPVGRSVSTVSGITGVAGDSSVRELVATATLTPWPFLTLAAGLLAALAGLAVLLTASRWPTAGARYGAQAPAAAASRGPADDWDSLSSGADPTAAEPESPTAEPGGGESGRGGSSR